MNKENKILTISLAISLFFHALIITFFDKINNFQINFFNLAKAQAKDRQETPLEFDLVNEPEPEAVKTFVETPEDARSDAMPEKTDYISDKNALARDRYLANDKLPGEPYYDGEIQHPVFAGGARGGAQSAETMNSASAKEQNKADDVTAPDPSLPATDLNDFSSSAERVRSEKFNRSLLTQSPGPRNPSHSLFGSDDLSYQNLNTSVEAFGGISLSTYAWEWGPYLLYLKRLINQHIYPPPAFYRMGMINGETELKFKILKDGQVLDLKVLSYQGHESLMRTSVAAIKSSSPYKPLPEDFPEEYLELTIRFIYTNIR